MTDEEALQHMREHTPLDQVRRELSGIIGQAEQAGMQSRPPSPIETRKSEFSAVERLLAKAEEVGLVRRN